jgi:hypothetical protein
MIEHVFASGLDAVGRKSVRWAINILATIAPGTGWSALGGWSAATIGEARPRVLRSTRRMGEDLRLEARTVQETR